MTSLATLPAHPVPGRDAQLSFGLTESGANYLRVWITDAPDGTEERKKLDANGEKRIVFYVGDAKAAHVYKPAVGGVYKLLCQEYAKGSGYGGAYEDDPNGAPSETKVGAETSIDFIVGQRVTQQLGYGADVAALVWWVFGAEVQPTTNAVHGEETPAIQAPSSLRATIAAADSDVQSYVTGFAEQPVAGIIGDLGTVVAELITKFNAHLATGATVHNAADTENKLAVAYGASISPKSLPDLVNRVLLALKNHELNIDPAIGSTDSLGTHQISSVKRNDRANLPIVESVGDIAQAYAGLGDIHRAYEAHRVSLNVHGTADSTNTLNGMPALLLLHSAFFKALASLAPTAPATMNSGVVTAVSVAGFTEG